ncbi:MAG: outer membrane protein transport protein [Deltaproteobacteria bacterium]|nr:outer membrane protein transport protein [Deltaproteobacteria bacterium]
MRKRAIALGLAACAIAAPRPAFADTEEGFYYSDDAALVAGAVTAWTRDAGAVWYNPAGLVTTGRTQLSLNGTIYALKIRKVPDALRTTFPGVGRRDVDIESSDIMSAPHATAFVRPLSDTFAVAVGIYITQRDVRTSASTLEVPAPATPAFPADALFRQHLDIALELTKYELGPAFGWQIAPNVRVGASVFVTYTKTSGLAVFEVDGTATAGTPTQTAFVASTQHATVSEVGLVSMIGVQWDPAPRWHVGATVRTPEMRFTASAEGSQIDATATTLAGGPADARLGFTKVTDAGGAGLTVPPRIAVGVSHEVSDRVVVSAEGDVLPRVTDASTGTDTRTIVNARAGVRLGLGESLYVGLGVFSDRDRQVLGSSFTDERIDRYGVTAGLQLLTPFTLHGESGPRENGLVLGTTLAMRYAAGVGEVRALDVEPGSGRDTTTRIVDVLFHELTPYIGTAVTF